VEDEQPDLLRRPDLTGMTKAVWQCPLAFVTDRLSEPVTIQANARLRKSEFSIRRGEDCSRMAVARPIWKLTCLFRSARENVPNFPGR
jgi:hypothetical protein